jgi:hypothetical protein
MSKDRTDDLPIFTRWGKLFLVKIGFSGFLLGNRKNLAVVANANSSLFSAKIPG